LALCFSAKRLSWKQTVWPVEIREHAFAPRPAWRASCINLKKEIPRTLESMGHAAM
jgi:hypothetical protein